jgi:predicted TPR repeat methyltransferase
MTIHAGTGRARRHTTPVHVRLDAAMGEYSSAAEFCDLLYADQKDGGDGQAGGGLHYPAEARLLRTLIDALYPRARSVLDVGCGTGAHARAPIDIGYDVDGIDLERRSWTSRAHDARGERALARRRRVHWLMGTPGLPAV